MKKLVYCFSLISCLSSLAMNFGGPQQAKLCNEFWNNIIEKTNVVHTNLLEELVNETNVEKRKSLKSDRDKANLKLEKQREALRYCIKEGINESFDKFKNWIK